MLSVIAGHDARDTTSAGVPVPDFLAGCGEGVRGLRIGVVRELSDGIAASTARTAACSWRRE
jgi:Asp-tRNA(Asn)/Glu-tRNA(Gln) amidotransferase A subunit family amidase